MMKNNDSKKEIKLLSCEEKELVSGAWSFTAASFFLGVYGAAFTASSYYYGPNGAGNKRPSARR
ncbi:hypothetical protein [Vibrio cholerae]|uniref:Uncharacterized protein n=2 Tax=Vibrio cholerae TaxID=666 RepID=A0A544CA76_VIBCL|nr:hypothetical protein [Vibrio cholerae]TQP15518.1 hypothetical protein FLM02_06770 [Vibrio cholerae]